LNLPLLTIQGKGQPFVWLHGMLNSVESDSIYSFIDFDELSKIVSVVRYNACDKSPNGDYSWNSMTEYLLSVADAQKFDSMILGGYSMGSGTAIHAAIRFPERVKALILVTPPPAWELRKAIKAVYEKVALKANSKFIPEIIKRIILLNEDPPGFFEEMRPGTRHRLLEFRLGFEPQYYYSIYHGGAISDFPTREQIAQIKIPTLIITDPNDTSHPVEIARELHQLIQNSELFFVSSINDFIHLQKSIHDFILAIDHKNE
jgi:pimeloyl-ACP methyl ester carboxylesterase